MAAVIDLMLSKGETELVRKCREEDIKTVSGSEALVERAANDLAPVDRRPPRCRPRFNLWRAPSEGSRYAIGKVKREKVQLKRLF
jgi:hypothetical protein